MAVKAIVLGTEREGWAVRLVPHKKGEGWVVKALDEAAVNRFMSFAGQQEPRVWKGASFFMAEVDAEGILAATRVLIAHNRVHPDHAWP